MDHESAFVEDQRPGFAEPTRSGACPEQNSATQRRERSSPSTGHSAATARITGLACSSLVSIA